ncbi:MAG TPA: xylan esterase [Bacteroidales bacterium]|nr:xylan esterase [Bacteroidales bacterium]HCU21259.1 xylan esterase [Bacteroidales bacterium]
MRQIINKRICIPIVLLCLMFNAFILNSQVETSEINAAVNLKPEEENLDVFQQWVKWNNPGDMLLDLLAKEAGILYDKRSLEVAKIRTESEWKNRQAVVKEKLSQIIGPFPEKTPLNPRVTGVIKKEGFRIEKIIFESFPGSYVSGCLYVPEKIKGKAPAILNVIGHNQESFRNELYQVINYNLARKGMIVFAIDPPGQGEHVQNYDTTVKFSSVGYSVVEHNYFGNYAFLSGYSCANYFIWDGIRAIDYLVSRKDVDPDRIGVTGWSGGGTVTNFVAALDDRVKVSIPCSWANANKRLLETKAASDAEPTLYHSFKLGIGVEDLVELRAPKPTLLVFVSRDEYLSLQGAREMYSEAKNAFAVLNGSDNLGFLEEDSRHWLTPKIRLAIYSFFMKHFNMKGDPSEIEAEVFPREQLNVTPTGQIVTYLGGEMIFDVNKRIAEKQIAAIENSRGNNHDHLSLVRTKAMQLSGYEDPSDPGNEFIINGRYQREGYTVGKYAIEVGSDYAIPVLLFVPDDNKVKHPAIIYLNPKGKVADAKPGGEIEKLVKKGYIVAAVDPLGTGEVKNSAAREHTESYTALLIGKSIPGIRASDIVRVADVLSRHEKVDPQKIGAVGIDDLCIPLIHAASFNNLLSSLVLIGSPGSYRSIAMNRDYRIGFTTREGGGYWHPYEVDFNWGVPGALTAYDLPDLIACIAPRKIVLSGMKNQMMEPADEKLVKIETVFPRSVYSSKNVSGNLKIVPDGESVGALIDWAFKE